MESDEIRALERDAQSYEDRSNQYVAGEASGLLDVAEECRGRAQQMRERLGLQHHEHLAQAARAVGADERSAVREDALEQVDDECLGRADATSQAGDRCGPAVCNICDADLPHKRGAMRWRPACDSQVVEYEADQRRRIVEDDLDDCLGL